MVKILIKNGRVWDGEKFFYADVLTEDKKIIKIEPNIEDEHNRFFDAKGRIVSAGLVDAHVHMRVTPNDFYGISAEMSALPFGVTAVADAGRQLGEKWVYDTFMVKSVVFVTACIKDGHADLEPVEELISRFGEKVIGIKIYFDTTLFEIKDVTPLKEVCDFAKDRGLKVMVHVANSPTSMAEIVSVLNKGDILTHCFHGGVNTAIEDNFECIKIAKEKGIIVDTAFAGNLHMDFGIFKKAIENKVLPTTVSTDITKSSAYMRGGRYGLTTCMSVAKDLGMTEEEIFKAVTSNPAKALGKEDEWGYLKVGRIADIAVFDYVKEGYSYKDKSGNRVENEMGYRCAFTVSSGQIVYKD